MNIHQLSVTYIQEQDRVLLRVSTRANASADEKASASDELRLWLTRRLLLGLLPALRKALGEVVARSPQTPAATTAPSASVVLPNDSARDMLVDFQRDAALKSTDFQTPYEPLARNLPLGSEPLLVTEVSLTPLAKAQLEMVWREKLPAPEGQTPAPPRSLRVALDQQLVHGFIHLLEQAQATANWMTNTAPAAATAPQATPSPGGTGEGGPGGDERPRYLN